MNNPALITLESISKSYGVTDTKPGGTPVLKDLSLTVDKGESVVITGPSGSGKSTLLNIIGTLDKADSGTVQLEGNDVSKLPEKELTQIRLRKIGFVFQLHYLLPQCTVLENVLIPTLPLGTGEGAADRSKNAIELLTKLGLQERQDHHPGQLSGGECQRVAVARALINKPDILLADEPTGSLDRKNADALAELLVKLNKEDGITLVVVTHSAELADHMERALTLRDGKLV